MRRFTLIIIVVLFVLLAIAAIFQGPALRELRRHSHPSPSVTPTASP
jgi:hypothetical protein